MRITHKPLRQKEPTFAFTPLLSSSVFRIQRVEHLNAKHLKPLTPQINSFASAGECDFMFKKSFAKICHPIENPYHLYLLKNRL